MLAKFVDEKFPKWAKILLCIFGAAASVYRIFLFVDDCLAKAEKKNVLALVIGIIFFIIPFIGIILGIIDIVFIIKKNEFAPILR